MSETKTIRHVIDAESFVIERQHGTQSTYQTWRIIDGRPRHVGETLSAFEPERADKLQAAISMRDAPLSRFGPDR